MKLNPFARLCLVATSIVIGAFSGLSAPVGTAFTYQGQLAVGGGPANGSYDFTFTLFDALTGGSTVASTLTQTGVGVTNGLFTKTLDFGNGIFAGDARWLEIGVRTNNAGSYTVLTPRQPFTPSPYAIFASGASVANTMPWSGLTGVPVGNGLVLGGGNTLGANFAGNGAANTVSRSDHDHFGQTWSGAGLLGLGLIDTTVSGATVGLSGQVASPDGYGGLFKNPGVTTFGGSGVLGLAGNGSANDVHPNGDWWGAGGEFAGPNGVIGAAVSSGTGGDGIGVIGMSPGENGFGAGVYGWATATNAINYGVYGQSDSSLGHGVYGLGGASGVGGSASSLNGLGGQFENRYVSDFGGAGVRGMAASGSVDDIHPFGYWWGAGGEFAGPDGLIAAAVNNHLGADGYGIIGMAPGTNGDARAVYGWAKGTNGVNYGIYGQTDSQFGYGVYGASAAGGTGLYGSAPDGTGVSGSGYFGVIGTGDGNGVYGYSATGVGVVGSSYSDAGLAAGSVSGSGISAHSDSGTAIVGNSYGDFNHPQLQLQQLNSGDFCRIRMSGINPTPGWDIATGFGTTPQMNFYSGGANKMVLDYFGNVTATSFNPISDRSTKENFEPISAADFLAKVAALPISSWNFKQDPAAKHVGPMAQDFYTAFGLGRDEKHIATVDADGVALAAIQGLNQKLQAELGARDAQIDELKRRLEQLETLVGRSKY